jgi:hypothetical protein
MRLVDDGEAVEVALPARVRDRERAALEFVRRQLLRTRPARQVFDGLGDADERETVREAHHGHHQTLFRLDRDTDVDVSLLDDGVLEH